MRIDVGVGGLEVAVSPEKKAQDAQKREGEAAILLIDGAAVAASAAPVGPDGCGRHINFVV